MLDGNEHQIRRIADDVIIYVRCSSSTLSYIKIKYSLNSKLFRAETPINKVNLSMPKFHPTDDRLIVESDGNLFDLDSQAYIQNSNLTSILDYEIIPKSNAIRYYVLYSSGSDEELIRIDESSDNFTTYSTTNALSASNGSLYCNSEKCITASS